jgi:hypothetical protein
VILYYALGGGLGHLTRARKVLAALRLSDDAVLLTASRFARDPRVTGGLPVAAVLRRLGRDRDAVRGSPARSRATRSPTHSSRSRTATRSGRPSRSSSR